MRRETSQDKEDFAEWYCLASCVAREGKTDMYFGHRAYSNMLRIMRIMSGYNLEVREIPEGYMLYIS